MSAIALSWVASIQVGNQTAKQLLLFYASHNFNKPGFEFKNETLANQLEVTERAIQKAHKLLIEKEFIIKENRYSKNGCQLSSSIYLNIPQEFVDKFFYQRGEDERSSPLGVNVVRGEGERRSPLNNNINNNINNKKQKSFYENEKKHDWAESKNKMACEKKHIEEHEKRKNEYQECRIDNAECKINQPVLAFDYINNIKNELNNRIKNENNKRF